MKCPENKTYTYNQFLCAFNLHCIDEFKLKMLDPENGFTMPLTENKRFIQIQLKAIMKALIETKLKYHLLACWITMYVYVNIL